MDAPYQAREPGAATLAAVGFDSTLARMPDWLRKVKHWSGLLFLARVSEAFPSGEVVEEKFDERGDGNGEICRRHQRRLVGLGFRQAQDDNRK